MKRDSAARCLFVLIVSAGSALSQIYADFETSMGDFTCELKHVESPMAVANFIGLAEGSRRWIDPATGALRNGVPYYDGVIFHRVISEFMNQSGSRNGMGTDSPGYTFRDEVTNGLTHTGKGILSMANSGKNTNGAQFFITAGDATHLDGIHTIFGQVTSGQDVVDAINAVPKGPQPGNPTEISRPLTDVVIQSVTIRRVGGEAEAFDIDAQGLPVCAPLLGRLSLSGAGGEIEYIFDTPQSADSIILGYGSSNLIDWSRMEIPYRGGAAPDMHSIDLGTAGGRGFFQLASAFHPGTVGPIDTINHDLAVSWGTEDIRFLLDGTGEAGTAVYSENPTNPWQIIDAFLDAVGPYRATWIIRTVEQGYIKIEGGLTSKSGSVISGQQTIYLWRSVVPGGEFSWRWMGSGPMTLSVP